MKGALPGKVEFTVKATIHSPTPTPVRNTTRAVKDLWRTQDGTLYVEYEDGTIEAYENAVVECVSVDAALGEAALLYTEPALADGKEG